MVAFATALVCTRAAGAGGGAKFSLALKRTAVLTDANTFCCTVTFLPVIIVFAPFVTRSVLLVTSPNAERFSDVSLAGGEFALRLLRVSLMFLVARRAPRVLAVAVVVVFLVLLAIVKLILDCILVGAIVAGKKGRLGLKNCARNHENRSVF